jgi:hypothetical protein
MYCVSCEVRTEFIYVMYKKVDPVCGLVVRVPGYRTEMYHVSCEARTEFMYVILKKVNCLCGLVVRVPGYRTEMYCVSSEVRTEFICCVEECRPRLWSSGSWLQNGDILCFLWGTNWLYVCYVLVQESRPSLWSSGQSSGYRSRGPCSIPGATRFSEK